MKFTISRDNLTFLLERAVHTIPTKDVKDILKYFLFDLKPNPQNEKQGILRVLSFDMELGCVVSLNVDMERPGAIGVPARKMMDIAATLGKESVAVFDVDTDLIKIRSGSTSWTIHGKSANQYPETPVFDQNRAWKVSRKNFLSALNAVYKSCAREDTKHAMVAVHIDGNHVLATDGHRAYRYSLETPIPVKDTILIHYNACRLLSEVLLLAEGDLWIMQDEFYILFKTASNDLLFSIGVEETPIQIDQRVFAPTDALDGLLVMDRKAFQAGIRRVAVCSDSGTICMAFTKDVGKQETGSLRLFSRNATDDSAEELISDVKWNGADFDSRQFFCDFFEDALNALSSEKAELRMPSDESPIRFRFDEGPFSAVILPRGKKKAAPSEEKEEPKEEKKKKTKKAAEPEAEALEE